MIYVTGSEFEIIQKILETNSPPGEVWAFGSRHKGTHRKHSDLDLAVVGNGRQSLSVLGNLKEAFMDSILPFRVEVLDYHALEPSFQKIIDAEHEVIFKSKVLN
jgi:predicted nucleotidyltransferase